MSSTAPPPDAPRTVGLIHTVASLPELFQRLSDSILDGVRVVNRVDESLLGDAIERGLTDEIGKRLAGHVRSLVADGADVVMVTCSSMGPVVDRLAPEIEVPLLRVDAEMVEEALRTATRLGVLATLETTMAPTVELVRRLAISAARDVEVVTHLCEGAFDALKRGDVARHDELVRDGLRAIEPRVDVVILAQASMARVVLGDGVGANVPILTSPGLAVERLARLLADDDHHATKKES